MGIKAQAEKIGFQIIGELTRCVDMEPTHLYQCYFDEAQNEFILRRGKSKIKGFYLHRKADTEISNLGEG